MFSLGQTVTFEIDGKRASSTIIGWKLNNNVGYVVTDFLSDQSVRPKGGDGVIMSMENKGSNYRAVLVFIDALPKTGMLFVLKGNDENTILMKSLRQVERFQCLIPAKLTGHDGEKIIITDISENGLSLKADAGTSLKPDTTMAVKFNAGGIGNVTDLNIQIIRANPDGGHIRFATKLVGASDENKRIIASYAEMCRKWDLN